MITSLRYRGHSAVDAGPYRSAIAFRPNLSREPVWLKAELKQPVRFREAMSALHEVVVGDFRFRKKDKTAYREWLARQEEEEQAIRKLAFAEGKQKALAKAKTPPPPDLDVRFRKAHRLYWNARVKWANELARHDPELFRHLVPCDPIVTVAPDVVFFEGFAKDESSYGCVFLDRDGLGGAQDASLGTTNVDYSMALYEGFQTLRTYRASTLEVDPSGFGVQVEGAGSVREEKIDLPPSWLRGFGQLSAATALTSTTVDLPVETLYAVLAHLKRHREKAGPRAIRFELVPGRAPTLVLEPWDVRIESHGRVWDGAEPRTIKVWGRRRLQVLARLLPIAARVEVRLLGSGLPSLWTVRMGELRFVLGLSGWTTNDWASGAQLDVLVGDTLVDVDVLARVEESLRRDRTLTRAQIANDVGAPESATRAALHRLCKQGQAIFDYSTNAYRYRQILDAPLGESLLGPEPTEVRQGREHFVDRDVKILRREPISATRTLYVARVNATECEAVFDADGQFGKARCPCPHHQHAGLRKGPCRHLIALRLEVAR